MLKKTISERINESRSIMLNNPNCIPIIFEKVNYNQQIQLTKSKFIVSVNITIGQLIYLIHKFIKCDRYISIFIFINGNIPPNSALIYDVYEQYKNKDGFLYIKYTTENTFG